MTSDWGSGPGLPIVSLFSGCGGLDLGFEWALFSPGLALDSDPVAVRTYNYNRTGSGIAWRVDLSKVSGEDVVDLWSDRGLVENPVGVIGGPPCQAFSISNVHARDDDPRVELAVRYADLIVEIDSLIGIEFFVFENVRGILRRKHRTVYEDIKRRFTTTGFRLIELPLDAVDYGVPQYRPRVFVVGVKGGKPGSRGSFVAPAVSRSIPKRTVGDVITGLPEPVQYRRGLDPGTFPVHPNHWCMRPRSEKFTNGSLRRGRRAIGRSFRVLDADRPSWTVAYGHREVHIHPGGHRRLSVFEAMRLQGFPDTYCLLGSMSDQIRLVSDAVPPPLALALARSVREYLLGSNASLTEADAVDWRVA